MGDKGGELLPYFETTYKLRNLIKYVELFHFTLKQEVARSSKMSVSYHYIICKHNPE